MHRTVLVAGALVSTVFVLSTGAFPFGASDQVHDDISVRPADGPNGGYAVLNGDDQIELLLTDSNPNVDGGGVSADAVTPLDRVFTITCTGDRYARVWITDDSDDVHFYRGDDHDRSIEGSSDGVSLAPSETVTVGLLVDTRGDDVESADTFTIHAEVAEPESHDDFDIDQDYEDDEHDPASPTATPTPTPTDTPRPTDTPTATATGDTAVRTATETSRRTDSRVSAGSSPSPTVATDRTERGGNAANAGGGARPVETARFDLPLLLVVFLALSGLLSLGVVRRTDLV